ncbi:MAG: hypothetical protein KAJ75_07225 [Alphaproteobacteria bacterium]|nr:hypothetical protein [Alphaproteobacteria bacterium]
MSRLFSAKTNFSAGELAPEMLGRGDLQAYANGAMKLKNVFIHPTGGVSRRSGLRYIGAAQGKGRLIAFEFNTEQAYLLVFTNQRVDVFKDGENVANFAVPWTEEQIKQINWAQSADSLLVVHPDVSPRKITRTSHTDWSISEWQFFEKDNCINQPYYKFAGVDVTIQTSATTGTVTLTSSASVFTSNHVGVRVRFLGGEAEITSYSSGTSVQASVKKTFSGTGTTKDWKEQSFSDVHGFAASVTHHQDRLVIGGSRDLPNHLWFSKTSDLMNFDLGEGLDDESIEFSILSDQVNAIRAVFSGRHLQVFTSGAEWMVSGDPLTPSAIQLKRQTRVGSAVNKYIPPVDVDGATLFISGNGLELREFLFTDVEQAYQANDLAMLSRHLMNSPVDQDYDSQRRLLTIVMENGNIATVTNYRAEQVTAWTGHSTDGKFLSVATIGSDTYVLVERGENVFVEIFDDDFGTDCGITGEDETPKDVWSGLSHLEGKTVKVLADGAVVPNQTVTDGIITLPYPVSNIQVGLAYTHIISPLPPMITAAGSVRPPKSVRLVEASFRVLKTSSMEVDTGRGIKPVLLKRLGVEGVLDSAPSEYSGDVRIRAFGWIRDFMQPSWKIEGDKPLSCTVLSVTTEMKVND